jgi:hypothetical protein
MLVSDGSRIKLSLMDVLTGATIWSLPLAGCLFGGSDDQSVVALQCDNGRTLRLIDIATGTVRATRDLGRLIPAEPSRLDPSRPELNYSVTFADGVIAVRYGPDDSPRIAGLSPVDLSTVWTGPVAVPPGSYLYNCGPDLCAEGSGGMVRLDPANGGLVADQGIIDAGPDTAEALDVLGGDGRARPPAIVLDPSPVPSTTLTSGRDDLVEMYDGLREMSVFAGAYPTWVLRAVPDRAAAHGYRFATVGQLDGVLANACFATPRYLACVTADETLTFFDLPPEARTG